MKKPCPICHGKGYEDIPGLQFLAPCGYCGGRTGAAKSANDAAEAAIIDIRERAARVCQLAESENAMRQGREIIIICERYLTAIARAPDLLTQIIDRETHHAELVAALERAKQTEANYEGALSDELKMRATLVDQHAELVAALEKLIMWADCYVESSGVSAEDEAMVRDDMAQARAVLASVKAQGKGTP